MAAAGSLGRLILPDAKLYVTKHLYPRFEKDGVAKLLATPGFIGTILSSMNDFNFEAVIDDYVLTKHKDYAVDLLLVPGLLRNLLDDDAQKVIDEYLFPKFGIGSAIAMLSKMGFLGNLVDPKAQEAIDAIVEEFDQVSAIAMLSKTGFLCK